MNMGIDEPRGYCPTCGRTDYHATGCPGIRRGDFGPTPRQHRGLTGMQWFLLLLLVVLVAASLFFAFGPAAGAAVLAMGFPPLVPHNQDDFDNDWRRAQRRSRWSTVAAVVGGLLFALMLVWLASKFLT